ncbi:stalk domain-containing protein [Paenibacillus harenae]|uniref:Copper amine oxidase-like N-terminal domain-containing protein n=1 Tax=Paenibacillus harenae TaxID=306543 RepID=A0ABT9TXV6_PAEHA|nr:stalk domain-containing protein [Paenibacillus harenae]MDQ0112198.1 hypothetical protein [Paenibacillus harenae]
MKLFGMKKSALIATMVAATMALGGVTVFAASGVQKISAFLNHDIKFVLDGKSWSPKDSDGNKLSAVVIDGSTYVPLKAVGEAFGADVKWEGSTKTIKMTSPSGGEGIPYKDGDTNGGTNADADTKPTTGGIFKLGSTDETTAKMKKEAVNVIKLYAKALESGDTSAYDAYVDAHTSDTISGSPISLGRSYYKDKFAEEVEGSIEANDASTITDYAAALSLAKESNIEVEYVSTKNEFSQSFKYSFLPEGWSAFSMVFITFEFSVTKYEGSDYVLEAVRVS